MRIVFHIFAVGIYKKGEKNKRIRTRLKRQEGAKPGGIVQAVLRSMDFTWKARKCRRIVFSSGYSSGASQGSAKLVSCLWMHWLTGGRTDWLLADLGQLGLGQESPEGLLMPLLQQPWSGHVLITKAKVPGHRWKCTPAFARFCLAGHSLTLSRADQIHECGIEKPEITLCSLTAKVINT